MWVEVFVAALATFVWANTVPGVVNSVAFNIMFVASVSTVLFNANPLLRFDGYYIFSDILDLPNLHQRAMQTLRHLVEYHAFGVRASRSPARSPREQGWLVAFGLASNIYRFILFGIILLFLADRFLILGVILTVVCLVSWIVLPIGRGVAYLATSPRLERTRLRAVGLTVGTCAALFLVLGGVPWSHHFRAPGVIEARQHSLIAPDTPGTLVEVLARSGARVAAGQPLFRLENPELALELQEAESQVDETRARELRALRGQTADVAPLASRRQALEQRLQDLVSRQDALVVRAPHAGVWVAPRIADAPGAWLQRGQGVGQVVDETKVRFVAVVSQEEASRLFEGNLRAGEVRLPGDAGVAIRVVDQTVIPADRQNLPAPALGWRAGGTVQVNPDDSAGTQAAEPFFEVRANLAEANVAQWQGRSGWLRYALPPEPLLTQGYRAFRQLLQKRYGL
jgi:putative peptide zinc metalloprotease protein